MPKTELFYLIRKTMINTLGDIVSAARAKGKKRLVVAYGQDAHTLEAVSDAVNMGLVEPTIMGDEEVIREVCAQNGLDFSALNIIHETNDVACVSKAVRMVGEGQGDVLMKGLVSTDKYMRGILSKEFGLVPPKGVLSHVTVMQLPAYRKLVVLGDVAIIPYPDLKQKTAIIKYLISTAHSLGIECPKVALIAPSEQVLPGVTSSVEAAVIAKMADRGQLGNALIDGPLALDVALVPEIVEIKKLKSSVAGDADCLLFPNLDSSNSFFKSATQLCGAELACMVVGTTAPCVLTSRGDTRSTKLNSIALACLSAK